MGIICCSGKKKKPSLAFPLKTLLDIVICKDSADSTAEVGGTFHIISIVTSVLLRKYFQLGGMLCNILKAAKAFIENIHQEKQASLYKLTI